MDLTILFGRFHLCTFNQSAFIHTTVKKMFDTVSYYKPSHIHASHLKEQSRSSTVTSLRTTPCVCHTSLMKTLMSTLNEAQTTADVPDTVREETPARCRLALGSPTNISTRTSLSGCWSPHSMWAPLSARRAPPSVTSPSKLRASE